MRTIGLKKILQIFTVLAITTIVLGYSYLEVRGLLQGPSITIETPSNGQTTTDSILTLTGQALNVQVISLNGREILIDETGNFTEKYLLFPGYNVVVFRAEDRFDNNIEKKLEIIYSPIKT